MRRTSGTYLPFPLKQLFPYVKKGLHRKLGPEDGVYEFLDLIGKYPPKPPAESVESDDLAALLYTGGTTGLSKGVMLTHRNCSVVVQQMDAWFFDTHKGNETQIAIFPFFHVAGFTAMMNFSLYSGFSQILVPRPDPDNGAQDDQEVQAVVLRLRPDHLRGAVEPPGL